MDRRHGDIDAPRAVIAGGIEQTIDDEHEEAGKPVIREIAILTIDPANAAAFEAAVGEARPLFLAAEGCLGMHLERVIEEPGSYRLVVVWETVEAHTETFRGSPAFQQWRALAGPWFTSPPQVVHSEQVAW